MPLWRKISVDLKMAIFVQSCKCATYRVEKYLKLSIWITSRDVIPNTRTNGRVLLCRLDLNHMTTDCLILPDLHTIHGLLEMGIVVIFIYQGDVYMKCRAIKRWSALIHCHDIECVTKEEEKIGDENAG